MECINLDKFYKLLTMTINNNWSDIHITTNEVVYYRQKNNLYKVNELIFSIEEVDKIKNVILNEGQQKTLKNEKVIDFAYEFLSRRFRINIYATYKGLGIAIRLINNKIIDLGNFHQFNILKNIINKRDGLILICGATGTGKSTTLAAMLEYLNQTVAKHIITLEEPIEYVFTSKNSLIHQREYQIDFFDFDKAIKMAMRQDPDIIMVGEIRDSETMKACLNASETGHLVLGTLHASSVIEAIMRMESFFPAEKLAEVNMQIASSLNSIIVQNLVPMVDDNLICCMDILLGTTAVKNIINKGKLEQLISQIQLNKQKGMQCMRDEILELEKKRLISEEVIKNMGLAK